VHRYAESQEQLAALTRQVFASGRAVHGKLAYRSNADRLHDLIYWLQGVQEEGPHPRALLGVLVDVSELRAMEREQRALRRQLVELTQVLPALLFQVRYTPDGKFAPVFISHHARQLTGFSAEALMSSFAQIAACMSPRALRQLMLALRRARRSQLPVEQELVLDGGGGRPLWARLEAVCQRDGDAYIYTGYVIDVTQVKLQTQSLSRAKQEAEQAARVKDVFLATMSHEIRTPMSGLIGVLELMHRAQLPSEDQHLLDMARGAARSLLRILNDVLDFAKSQSGRLSIETRPFSLRAVVDEVAGLFAPDIKRKGLHFDVHVGALVAPAYLGDGQRVAQVLMNLVGNALKFTTEGGIALLVEAQPADAVLGRQEVAITVKDTGIGIDAAEQAMLFEPFVQAGARQQGGTGLGLAICKRLIQAMHGDIQLRSRLGEGTEVQLRLAWPLGSLALEDTEAASERACHATAKTPVAMLDRSILLVEDQPLNRELLGRQLEAVGIKAYDTAANGLEGWQAYVRQVHGLVITDCAMPGMDGEALIRRIRAHEAGTGRRAYLVALTANAVDSQRNACLEAGADEVMLKPMHLPQLRDLLARAFDSARTPSPPELPEGIPAEDWPRLREQLVMHMRQDMQVARARLHEQDWSRARDAVHRIVGTASWFKLADIAGVARTLQLALEEAHAPATLVESLQSAIAAMDAGCRGA
jgi:signal transduction histidine kinase/DNA-binding response OmpR family regulator